MNYLSMLLSALAVAVSAAPLTASLSARATPGLQAWADPFFTGTYVHYTGIGWDTCYPLPEFAGNGISSVKADDGNWCILYPNPNCTPGGELWVISPYDNMGTAETNFDDRAQSFKCSPWS